MTHIEPVGGLWHAGAVRYSDYHIEFYPAVPRPSRLGFVASPDFLTLTFDRETLTLYSFDIYSPCHSWKRVDAIEVPPDAEIAGVRVVTEIDCNGVGPCESDSAIRVLIAPSGRVAIRVVDVQTERFLCAGPGLWFAMDRNNLLAEIVMEKVEMGRDPG